MIEADVPSMSRTSSLGYEPNISLEYNVPKPKQLRASSKICDSCGCTGACHKVKPAVVSVETEMDPFGEDLGLIDPFPKRALRISPNDKTSKARLIDPTVIQTLVTNVSVESVSFPVAIRSMVRFGNSLCGQN